MSCIGKIQHINDPLSAEPLSPTDATSCINGLALNSANVLVTKHAEERMQERGVSFVEALTILQNGVVRKKAEKRSGYKYWAYKVEYIKFSGNQDTACVVALKSNRLILISVMQT